VSPRGNAGTAAGLTDPGLQRGGNEDAYLLEPPLYAVADGMGGHRAGEIASRVAVDALLADAPRRADSKSLGRAVRTANRAVIDAAEKSRTRAGMGTTLTAVMVDGTHLALAHVGDSRAYLLHDGALERLTEDHSMVADLVRQGTLTEEDARFHPQRSVITRALGSDPNMVADTFDVQAAVGDRLLLCSDGLSAMLTDDTIGELLRTSPDPQAATRTLVDAANRAGGYDNITVIVVDLDETPAADLSPARGSAAAGRRIAARLLWVVAALALVAAGMYGTWAYARSRAYLADDGGYVAVYRGLPGSLGSLSLSWLQEKTDIPVDRLPLPVATRLKDGIPATDLAAALRRVSSYRSSLESSASTDSSATPAAP
jgi:serine/threonine protein phosphatase PrpC